MGMKTRPKVRTEKVTIELPIDTLEALNSIRVFSRTFVQTQEDYIVAAVKRQLAEDWRKVTGWEGSKS